MKKLKKEIDAEKKAFDETETRWKRESAAAVQVIEPVPVFVTEMV